MKLLELYINESLGKFKGQNTFILKTAKSIYNKLQSIDNIENFKVKLSKQYLQKCGFKFIFFNDIFIKFGYNTQYNLKYSKFDKDNNIMDLVHIEINFYEYDNYQKIARALTHELLHAYEDFNRNLNNKDSLQNAYDKKYKKTLSNENIEYGVLLNNITKIEQNAYLNELNIELPTSKFNIFDYNTFDEAFDAAKKKVFINSSTVQVYNDVLNKIQEIYDGTPEEQDKFTNTYNKINNKNWKFNKIYNKVNNVLIKIFDKIDKRILDIFKEYFDLQMKSKNI